MRYVQPRAPQSPNQSAFIEAAEKLSFLVAVTVVFLTWPALFDKTAPFIRGYALKEYGDEWVPLLNFSWAVVSGLGIFYLVRMSLLTTAMGAALAVATKFVA